MSAIGTLYRVPGEAVAGFEGLSTLPEFYQAMGAVTDADTPDLKLSSDLRSWNHHVKSLSGPLGTLFVGDLGARSDAGEPWVIVHRAARVASIEKALAAFDLTALPEGTELDRAVAQTIRATYEDVTDFFAQTVAENAAMILLYEG